MDLSGTWSFELDPQDIGITEAWYRHKLAREIQLPGSLQEQGYGDEIAIDVQWTGDIHYHQFFTDQRFDAYRQPGNVKLPFWLQPDRHYVGVAWYQRSITIPEDWRGTRLVVVLERPHWETRLWLDDREIGLDRSLSTPHIYDLGAEVTSGPHILTIRVDNRMIVNIGPNSHSVSDHTQTNWNGIAGKLELLKSNLIWFDDVQVYSDVARKAIRVHIQIESVLKSPVQVQLLLQVNPANPPAYGHFSETRVSQMVEPGSSQMEVMYVLGDQAHLWDEFHPALYRLDLSLQAETRETFIDDRRTITFGLREVGVKDKQITVNGKKTFLRGTLECCVFPQTGYPPTDIESWKRIIKVCQSYGLNHIRFHSYCPPEAAFIAGDELGMYFQVECASWANQGACLGKGDAVDEWLYEEGHRIIKAYGNHPSFLLMAYGNEPDGNISEYLSQWVTYWKEKEPRRLHTSGAGWPLLPENDFLSTPTPRIQAWGDGNTSRINARPPETFTDYQELIAQYDQPVVSHEIGQWCAFPNLEEIEKYTDYLKAKNFEIFRDFLTDNHMGDQAHDFLMASGKLQVLCYKEEIESALRTPGFGGFQLLGLQDFPGQGTALVGVLDAFWESKGYVTPEEYRRFCNSTVLLAKMSKRYWKTSEFFSAEIEIAHFGASEIKNTSLQWQLVDETEGVHCFGAWQVETIPAGNLLHLGVVQADLHNLLGGKKYKLEVRLKDANCQNDWDIWVFANELTLPAHEDILITPQLDQTALQRLEEGGKVLWVRTADQVRTPCQIGFSSIFWNTAWTGNQAPHTLGILCDPNHPVFAHFPTEYHSNWQWWELIHGAAAMIMDELSESLRPLIQPIDTWFDSRRLGLLFEGQVNGGKLMACSMDILSNPKERLVARQMLCSILQYMSSDAFYPNISFQPEEFLQAELSVKTTSD
jgi:hypothetical protein